MAWFDGLSPDGRQFTIMMAVASGANENLATARDQCANAASKTDAAVAGLKLLQTWNVSAKESQQAIAAAEKATNAVHLAISRCEQAILAANKLLGA